MEDDEYNVSNFTDEELFHLMDLNNPSDRELEAKLYLMIEKYEGNKNKLSIKMCKFFNDVFRHFFSTDEDYDDEGNEGLEGFETQNTNTMTTAIPVTTAPTPPISTLTTNYSKGLLNPLLKETIKRIVCVDSQYRDLSVYPNPSNFTFNLSDTLTDVVSLKLYSVQIPYTWYTISNDFGSNFFILKGNVEGIDNGNFDLKVEIQSGNYQSNDFVTYINKSLNQIRTENVDFDFGSTAVSYNSLNAKLTMDLDIKLLYNETNYQLQFFDPSANLSEISNNLISLVDRSNTVNDISSIPELLGYTYNNHYPFSINSNIHTTGLNMNRTRRINKFNNQFHIDIYQGTIDNDLITNASTTNITTITIKMSFLGIKKVSDIIADVDLQIKSNPYIDATNSSFYYDTNDKRVKLKIRLNRKKIANGQNYKTKIRFDDLSKYPVWFMPDTTGNYTSLFKFENYETELNEIESDADYLITTYEIPNGEDDSTFILPKLSFISNSNPNYQVFNQKIEISGGIYTSLELLEEINKKLVLLKGATADAFDCSISTNISSLPVISSKIKKTIPYYDSSFKNNFSIKVNDSFFFSTFEFTDLVLNEEPNGNNVSIDRSFESQFDNGASLIEITDISNKIYITMNLNDGNGDILTDLSFEVVEAGVYSFLGLQTAINNFFNEQTNENMVLFKGSSISIESPTITNINYKCTLILKITVVLTNTNFDLHLSDPEGNMWSNFFGFNGHKFDVDGFPIDLSGSILEHNSVEIPGYDLSGKSLVDPSGEPLYNFSGNELLYDSNGNKLLNDSLGNLLVVDLQGVNLQYNLSENPPLKDSSGNNLLYNISGDPITVFNGLIPMLYDFQRVYFYTPNNVLGIKKLPSNLLYLTTINNHFKFKPVLDKSGGVYVSGSTNYDIKITLSLAVNKYYTREAIVEDINSVLRENGITYGSYITEVEGKTLFKVNINKFFTAEDYRIIFFDNTFTRCNFGLSSIDNVKWDTTLGWILGFRNQTQYVLTKSNENNLVSTSTYYTDYPNQPYSVDPITNIVTITGDTSINVNLFNYLLVVLDDYCQNHLNDGLVTVTKTDYDIPLPSYANRTTYQCDASGQLSIVNGKLTSKQLYSANQILNTKQINQKQNAYSSGPFTQDIFALIPIKTSGLSPGQSFVDFSGTLQNQERTYFGPVNIRKMTIQLLNDKGSSLDLNGANWSFSFIAEQLYNPSRN